MIWVLRPKINEVVALQILPIGGDEGAAARAESAIRGRSKATPTVAIVFFLFIENSM